MATNSYHELLWLSCAAKLCCSLRTVRPTGGDIWRIATQLQVSPERFLRLIPAEPAVQDGILLAPNSQPMHIALARRVARGRQAACVFLMQIGNDVARCGLGELRPLPCQAFPGSGAGGVLNVSEGYGCTCRAWSLADLDRAEVAVLLAQEAAERKLDQQLIGEWNLQVEMATRTTFSLNDFCGYLMQAYAGRVARGEP